MKADVDDAWYDEMTTYGTCKSWMNFCTAVEISIFVCSEQEGGPNRMILR